MPQNPLLVEHKWPKAITMPVAPAVPLLWPPQAGKEHIPVPKTTQKIFLTKNITEASCDSKAEALNASFKQGHTRGPWTKGEEDSSPHPTPPGFFFLFLIKKTVCFKQTALGLTVYNYK